MARDVCETVKVAAGNKEGYYICDADKIPKGATIYKKGPKTKTVWHAFKIGVDGAEDKIVETFNKKREATAWATTQEEPLTFKVDKEEVEAE